MPLIYRAMLNDGGKPKVDSSKKALGVRAGNDKNDDIAFGKDGNVTPGTGGMSVAPSWRDLPAYRIPCRLQDLCPKAAGSNEYECWRIGDGRFEDGVVTDRLNLVVDSPHHGAVQPSTTMLLTEYEMALADTRDQWLVEPETRSDMAS